MRIRAFSYFVSRHLQKHSLSDTAVVIDGHNYFYTLYSCSKIPYVFGSESNRFADYVREDLMKYKNANVKCYFIFKGSIVDIEKSLNKVRPHGKDFDLSDIFSSDEDIVQTIFAAEIYKQVLEEMEFEYVLCQNDCKSDCIALAQKLSCPIISFDIEYCFSGVDYIPKKTFSKNSTTESSIRYTENTKTIECEIFKLNDFLKSFKVAKENLSTFVVLTDDSTSDFFSEFFASARIPLVPNVKKISSLFDWLSKKKEDQVLKEIFRCITAEKRDKFLNAKVEVETTIFRKQVDEGIPTLYLSSRKVVEITERDPLWFEKGVCLGHVAVSFINLYKHKIVIASNSIEDYDQENSAIICLDIMKYAYDLLTNFNGGEIYLRHRKSKSGDISKDPMVINYSIRKPEYNASNCVFENGWYSIQDLKLFHHFIQETLQCFDFSKLDRAPKDSRLFIIALVYFVRRTLNDTKNEVYSIMLSYVMLSVVLNKAQDNPKPLKINATKRPLLDPTVDGASITADDCVIARHVLQDFFTVTHSELFSIFDVRTLHLLVQFQHCLDKLNNLNILCGKPFEPTKYDKTYNGTFVYKALIFLKNNGIESLKNMLNPAASVLAFLTGMMDVFEEVMY